MTTKSYLNRLISNDGYDFAVVSFKNRPPMAIERTITQNKLEEDSVVISVATGPHPIHEKKTASADHYLPIDEITGVTYYTETKIVNLKSL